MSISTVIAPYLTYVKIGAVLALLGAVAAGGYHFGGMASKTALEGFQAEQSANTAKAVLAERAAGAAELARVNAILKGYQDASIDPIALSVGSRVLEYARVADCPVPGAGGHPSGTPSASPVTSSASEVGQALTDLAVACSQDAAELTALQAAWPK